MILRINGVEIAAYPAVFRVTILDLDDADSSTRTSDGRLNRNRVAVKRQIDMEFNAMPADKISGVLRAMENVFFDFYYPDPMIGDYTTKTFYVGNRPAAIPIEKDGVIWWEGLRITLTEQ